MKYQVKINSIVPANSKSLIQQQQLRSRPQGEHNKRSTFAASLTLKRILGWDFERIVIAHGDLIEENAKEVAIRAWKKPLASAALEA